MNVLQEQRAARHAIFTGRAGELARFRAVLARREPGRVFIVHGPGGIGKTSLLLELALLCAPPDRAFHVDAGEHAPRPAAIRAALAPALTPAPAGGTTLLCLDGWDAAVALDGWLRETVIPALPDHVVLVVARRDPPDARWRSLVGWGSLFCAVALEPLDDPESRVLLVRLGVPAARLAGALAFAHGHPLALHLVAETVAGAPGAVVDAGGSSVVQTLAHVLLESIATRSQRAAVEAAALVHRITEPLLAALCPGEDAHALFRWLSGLSIVAATATGLHVHDLASEVIVADLRWRDPARYAALLERARGHLAAAWLRATGDAHERIGFELMYLSRSAPWLAGVSWNDAARPRVELAQPVDHAALAELVGAHEGAESAAIAARWMSRQPEAAYLYRTGDAPAPDGLTVALVVDAGAGSTLVWDPGAVAAWRAMARLGALRPGETAILIRYWVARATYQQPSAFLVEHVALVNRLQISTPGIRYGMYVLADPASWVPRFAPLGLRPLEGGDFDLGGRAYGIFANDFRRERPLDYFERSFQRLVSGAMPDRRLDEPPLHRLSRRAFGAAVQAALKGLHDDRALAASPLVDSRLTWLRTAEDDGALRVRALRDLLVEVVESLAGQPLARELGEILRRTYVEVAAGQKQVAYDLHLSWSTYRRRLERAIDAVTESLWRQETV